MNLYFFSGNKWTELGKIPCAMCGEVVEKEFSSLVDHLKKSHAGVSVGDYLQKFDLHVICGHQPLMHSLVMRQCTWCGLGCKSMKELREHAKESHGK